MSAVTRVQHIQAYVCNCRTLTETSLRARLPSIHWIKVLQRAFRNSEDINALGPHWPVSYSNLLSFATANCLDKIKELQAKCWQLLSVIDGTRTRAQSWESSSHKSVAAYLLLLLVSANSTLQTKACAIDNVKAFIQRRMKQNNITLRSSLVVEIYSVNTSKRKNVKVVLCPKNRCFLEGSQESPVVLLVKQGVGEGMNDEQY